MAKSSRPSDWKKTNQLPLGFYKNILNHDDYTLDMRDILRNMKSDIVILRIYDHINPEWLDIRYKLHKDQLINANFDGNEPAGEQIDYFWFSRKFSKEEKNYSYNRTISTPVDQRLTLYLVAQDEHVMNYCGFEAKGAISFISGGPEHIQATVCSNGLGDYRETRDWIFANGHDEGRRVSIAIKESN